MRSIVSDGAPRPVSAQVHIYHAENGRVIQSWGTGSLSWTPDRPLQILVKAHRPVNGQGVLDRDLLAAALERGRAGAGMPQLLYLTAPPRGPVRLLITLDGGRNEFALRPKAARAFLQATCEQIPLGEEPGLLDDTEDVLALLEEA